MWKERKNNNNKNKPRTHVVGPSMMLVATFINFTMGACTCSSSGNMPNTLAASFRRAASLLSSAIFE